MPLDGQLEVTVDQGVVELAFTVENAGVEPVELEFGSGLTADFAVFDGETEVWRWSDGRLFTQVMRSATLAPGESFSQSGTWEDPEPGEYVGKATLAARNVALRSTAGFAV